MDNAVCNAKEILLSQSLELYTSTLVCPGYESPVLEWLHVTHLHWHTDKMLSGSWMFCSNLGGEVMHYQQCLHQVILSPHIRQLTSRQGNLATSGRI